MAELLPKTWAMMFCSETLLSNAKVVPDLQNVWKPWPTGEILKNANKPFGASLM